MFITDIRLVEGSGVKVAIRIVLLPLVVADAVPDEELVPIPLIAETRYVYAVLEVNPVLEYEVAVEPVFDSIIDHVEPLLDDLSILYPVIGEPPLFDGAVHDRLICD